MKHCLRCDELNTELYDGLCDLCYYEVETCYGELAKVAEEEKEAQEETHDCLAR